METYLGVAAAVADGAWHQITVVVAFQAGTVWDVNEPIDTNGAAT
jgi:hypothetical protein